MDNDETVRKSQNPVNSASCKNSLQRKHKPSSKQDAKQSQNKTNTMIGNHTSQEMKIIEKTTKPQPVRHSLGFFFIKK